MSENYYIRLLPYIMSFSRVWLSRRRLHQNESAIILDNIFCRFIGFSALKASGFELKGGEA